jgi:hypothetical protein
MCDNCRFNNVADDTHCVTCVPPEYKNYVMREKRKRREEALVMRFDMRKHGPRNSC